MHGLRKERNVGGGGGGGGGRRSGGVRYRKEKSESVPLLLQKLRARDEERKGEFQFVLAPALLLLSLVLSVEIVAR